MSEGGRVDDSPDPQDSMIQESAQWPMQAIGSAPAVDMNRYGNWRQNEH